MLLHRGTEICHIHLEYAHPFRKQCRREHAGADGVAPDPLPIRGRAVSGPPDAASPQTPTRLDPNVESLIHHYYGCFNERRFAEAAKLFADDALVEHFPFGQQHRGPDGYLMFAKAWSAAFPDGRITIGRIDRRSD